MVLVVAGLIIGFLPFVPDVSLQPEVVLLGLLPLLVYDAAVTASPTAFFRHARSIGVLAVLLVAATAVVVAAIAHWVGHLSWPMAFVLGTAVGPTDASAATSIASRIGLPRHLVSILEGEALFNDATALVLYGAAVADATTGHISLLHTAGTIVYSAVAGAAIGLAVGFAGRWLRNRIDDPPIEIAGSILLAYAAYLPAEAIHASGVLAAVTAGLYLGWHSSGGAFSARSRLQSGAFWATLVFLVNAALFVLVGLSFHTFTTQARGPVGRLALTGAAVVAAVIVLRLAWMEGSGWFARLGRRRRAALGAHGWRERLVLGWAGMRGAITLAALLAVPVADRRGASAGRSRRDHLPGVHRHHRDARGAGHDAADPGATASASASTRRSPKPNVRPASTSPGRSSITSARRATCGQLPEEVADGLRAQYLGRLHWLETMSGDEDLEDEVAATAQAA